MTTLEQVIGNDAYIAFIYQDTTPEIPRNWHNTGFLVSFSPKLPSDDYDRLPSDLTIDGVIPTNKEALTILEQQLTKLGSWSAMEKVLQQHGAIVCYPVYLMDHSGLRVSTTPDAFQACDPEKWDWSQIGFIFATKASILRDYQDITPAILADVQQALQSEIEILDQYLRNDVYGYTVFNRRREAEATLGSKEAYQLEHLYKNFEAVDSLWSLYGTDEVLRSLTADFGDMVDIE